MMNYKYKGWIFYSSLSMSLLIGNCEIVYFIGGKEDLTLLGHFKENQRLALSIELELSELEMADY